MISNWILKLKPIVKIILLRQIRILMIQNSAECQGTLDNLWLKLKTKYKEERVDKVDFNLQKILVL